MPISPDTLSSIARDYAAGMSSIRGRRVQKLLKREFAGAEWVFIAGLDEGHRAVLGISDSGAALCATDGTGPQAPIVKWLHGSDTAFETQFDLLKDSLPVRSSTTLPIAQLQTRWQLRVRGSPMPDRIRVLLSRVLALLD